MHRMIPILGYHFYVEKSYCSKQKYFQDFEYACNTLFDDTDNIKW